MITVSTMYAIEYQSTMYAFKCQTTMYAFKCQFTKCQFTKYHMCNFVQLVFIIVNILWFEYKTDVTVFFSNTVTPVLHSAHYLSYNISRIKQL